MGSTSSWGASEPAEPAASSGPGGALVLPGGGGGGGKVEEEAVGSVFSEKFWANVAAYRASAPREIAISSSLLGTMAIKPRGF